MIVTQITPLTNSRSKIYIDHEFAFVLYKGELRLYHIKEGKELAEEDYKVIREEVLPKRAKLRAMNLLTKRDYTKEQLKKKLVQGDYTEDIIEIAVEYVTSYGYIDDVRYARDYIHYHGETKSKRQIEQTLWNKGIHKEDMENAWLEWEEMGGVSDEISMIQTLLDKKHYEPDQADEKEKRRIYGYLLRKGFSSENINKVMKMHKY